MQRNYPVKIVNFSVIGQVAQIQIPAESDRKHAHCLTTNLGNVVSCPLHPVVSSHSYCYYSWHFCSS